ncbi:Txe/YoeB family addiction module toxin [Vreelandella indica]|uniref:Txe/YoeB family addiction module toxin n=1 Tax=Vreelandella indica TaxID=3126500 RepID=UPI00300E27B4
MKLIFSENAWEDYLYWQKTDKKILGRINKLIKETKREPFEGVGKPEPLKHSLAGYWSRRDVTPSSVAPGFRVRRNFIVF